MAKILVADDNSNVQKTMALALADLGVEVVSVNNGEAAVRKLADVSPDLVLADIFMPVRNGYEVCEYVKKDPRFAHIPVILLVGAFDPLDEREAQRVGADGILKKPFVPPDPLITMVKTLLDRSMSLVGVAASKAPKAVQVKVAGRSVPEVQAAPPTMPEEPSPEEFPAPVEPVTFAEGDRPVAFGQLLDPPAQSTTASSGTGVIEPMDDEQILTSSRDATLGEPAFWRNDSPEVQPEAEQSTDSKDELSLHKWGQENESLSRREDAAMLRPVEPVDTTEAVEPLELVRDEQEIESTSHIDSEPVVLDQAAQAPLTVDSGKAPELAANPLEWLATAPEQNPEAALEPISGRDEEKSGGIQLEPEPEPFPGQLAIEPTPISSVDESEVEPASVSSIHAVEPVKHSEFAVEPDTQNANESFTESSAQTSPLSPATQRPEDTARSVPMRKWTEMTDTLEERASEIVMSRINSGSLGAAQNPAATQPNSQVAALEPWQGSKPDAPLKPEQSINPTATGNSAESAPPAASSSAPAVPDPALVEAVVQRVLDKMRPQVVDIITREFLRPVVQALVHREIEKQ